MRSRILVFLAVLALPVSLLAQSQQNQFTLFLNHATFHTTSVDDPDTGTTLKVRFDAKTGYGASYDRFFSPNVSAQFVAQRIRGDARIVLEAPVAAASFSEGIGTLDLNAFDAALHWHFGAPGATIRPYVGAGLASVRGAKLHVPADFTDSGQAEDFSFDDKITWVADAGIDWRIARSADLTLTAKYMPYSTGVGAEPGDPLQRLKLDPLTFAAGVSWRF
jgi:outer membrane protein W